MPLGRKSCFSAPTEGSSWVCSCNQKHEGLIQENPKQHRLRTSQRGLREAPGRREGNQLCAAPSSGAGAEHQRRPRETAGKPPLLRSTLFPRGAHTTVTPPEGGCRRGRSHILVLFTTPTKNISDTPGAPFQVLEIAAGADW